MKRPSFIGWYVIGLVSVIAILLCWNFCERGTEPKWSNSTTLEAKLQTTIKTELNVQKKLEEKEDSIFAVQDVIKSKQSKMPRTNKLLPKRSEMDSNSTFKVEGSKVTSDTNSYDSIRRLLIYKEMLNDSLIETTNELQFEVIKSRMSRTKSDSAFFALLAVKDEEIDSLQIETKKQYKKGARKGRKQGALLAIPAFILGLFVP